MCTIKLVIYKIAQITLIKVRERETVEFNEVNPFMTWWLVAKGERFLICGRV